MKNQVEEIKSKIDIVTFIGQYVNLTKAGRNFKGVCPFHQEKSPSFIVSPDRQIWHCFGTCGIGGDVVSFLMKWENIGFYEALVELAEKTGVVLDDNQYDSQEWKRQQKLISINNIATKFYKYLLMETAFGKKALQYLSNRQIGDKIINTFEIGYAPSSWNSLSKFLNKKGYSNDDIVASGLAILSSKNTVYDRFRNRIIFPLKDIKGNVLGFSGRILDSDKKEAKYVNSPETEIYHKRENLYGIHLTKESIRKKENVYIFEGEFDLITPFRLGVDNGVAIKGAAFTNEQLSLLKRYTKRITLALDMDEAGTEAMKRGIKIAEKLGIDVFIATFTKGKDPDEAGLLDPIQLKKDLKNAVPIYDFLISDLLKKYPEKAPFQKKKIAEEMAPYISGIQNPVVQSHYVKQLSKLLEVSEIAVFKMLRSEFQNQFLKSTNKTTNNLKTEINRSKLLQNHLIGTLLQSNCDQSEINQIFTIVEETDFETPSYGKLYQKIKDFYVQKNNNLIYADFVKNIEPEIRSVSDEIFMRVSHNGVEGLPSLIKVAREIRKNSLQRQINVLLQKDNTDEAERLKKITEEYNLLRKNTE
jgi:DNA primase